MANRFELQSGTGIIELQASIDDLLLQSDGVVAGDPVVGGSLPDAPHPISRTVAVEAQTQVSRGFLGFLQDVAKIFRAPLVTPRFTRPQPQYQFAANLLLTTLAAVAPVADPFTPANATQLDPTRARVHVRQAQQGSNLLLTTLSVPVGAASNGPVPGVHSQAQQPSVVSNLLGTTLAPVGADAPFAQPDWPSPAPRRRVAQPTDSVNRVLGLYEQFPTTGILDAFNRADENPLANGTWAALKLGAPALKLVSNALQPSATGEAGSYWTPSSFGPDAELYATVSTFSTSGDNIDLVLRASGAGGSSISDYEANFERRASGIRVTISKRVANITTLLTDPIDVPNWALSDGIGFSARGARLTAWARLSGVWQTVVSVNDSTLPNAGGSAIRTNTFGSTILDDVGGGTLSMPVGVSSHGAVARVRAVRQPDGPLNLLTTTLAVVALADPPFFQTEWLNPIFPQPLRQGVVASQLFGTPDIPAPFTQTAWPNPTRRIGEREWGSTEGLLYAAFVIPPEKPFLLIDWPNPTRRVGERAFQPLLTAGLALTTDGNGATGSTWLAWQRRRRR